MLENAHIEARFCKAELYYYSFWCWDSLVTSISSQHPFCSKSCKITIFFTGLDDSYKPTSQLLQKTVPNVVVTRSQPVHSSRRASRCSSFLFFNIFLSDSLISIFRLSLAYSSNPSSITLILLRESAIVFSRSRICWRKKSDFPWSCSMFSWNCTPQYGTRKSPMVTDLQNLRGKSRKLQCHKTSIQDLLRKWVTTGPWKHAGHGTGDEQLINSSEICEHLQRKHNI